MKKGRYQSRHPKRRKQILPIVFVAVVIVLILMLVLWSRHTRNITELPYNETSQETVEQNTDSIAIPGYEGLNLQADTKKQTLALSNPAQNACYFRIELYLEDGTLLWQSELIEPGTSSKPIRLLEKLEAGTYPNALLRYSCFKMDKELTPLNGAETKLTLWVK